MKSRKSKGRFAMLPHALLRHEAVTTLSPAHRWVLVAVAAEFNGKNNGAIVLTPAVAKDYGITSVDTLRKGLGELVSRGLVIRTDPGSYQPPKPARYALTWQPMNDSDYSIARRTPTHDYREWKSNPAVRSPDPTGTAHRTREPEIEAENASLGTAHRTHFDPSRDRSPDTSIDSSHKATANGG